MNDIAELKQYATIHAKAQKIPRYQRLLRDIRSDDHAPGSWTQVWCRTAEALERRGRYLEACRHYAMARFPYVDGDARREAQERCARAFDRWRSGNPAIEPLDLDLPGGSIRCWAGGLSTVNRRPLMLLMGGIVTVKEQHAASLAGVGRLGMSGVAAEMPGVGENSLRYDAGSWRMLSDLLDALSDRADVTQVYAIALSFSGHMALRCAVADKRIKGVITAGAPISDFFTDAGWQRGLPRITVDTLAHMMGTEPGQVADSFGGWALSPEELAALNIPVCYAAALRDEIIPPSEISHLKGQVRQLSLLERDDVHGCPRHVAETKLWSIASLLQIRKIHNPQSALINLLLYLQRARGRFSLRTAV